MSQHAVFLSWSLTVWRITGIRCGRNARGSGGRTELCASVCAGRATDSDYWGAPHPLDLNLRKDTFKMYPQGRHPVSNTNYIVSISARATVVLVTRTIVWCFCRAVTFIQILLIETKCFELVFAYERWWDLAYTITLLWNKNISQKGI